MSATTHDQLGFLDRCSALAALFLLIRLHALDEQATWARRRIGDPAAVGALYLRGGTVFVIVAILGSLVLTATRPVGAAGRRLGRPEAVARSTSARRSSGSCRRSRTAAASAASSSAPNAPIRGRGPPTPGSRRRSSARRATTSTTTGGRSPTTSSTTTAGDGPAATTRSGSRATPTRRSSTDTAEAVAKPGTKDVTFSVAPDQLRGTYALSPAVPLQIDRDRGPPRGRRAGLLPGGRDQRPRPVQDHGPGPAPSATTTAA